MTDSIHNEYNEQIGVLADDLDDENDNSDNIVSGGEDINAYRKIRRARDDAREFAGTQFVNDVVPDDLFADEGQEEIHDLVRPLKRHNAKTQWAELPTDEEDPDLDEFFNEFGTDRRTRISICRAYASYLSSLLPRVTKKK